MDRRLISKRVRRLIGGCAACAVAIVVTACGSSSSSNASSSGSGGAAAAPSSTSAGGSAATSSSGGGNVPAGKVIHIAVLYSSPLDSGYGNAHLDALRAAMNSLGSSHFTLKTVDNVPFTNQLTQTAEQLFQGGADLVVDMATAGELFYKACQQVPDKYCLEGYPVGAMPANTAGYWTDTNSLFYVEGVTAGLLTKSGNTGFVNAIKIPASTALVNAFALGCQSVKPDCTVHNIYLDSFTDPPAEVEAANTLANGGADVIGHFMDDPATLKTAAGRGIWSYGLYANQESVAPKQYVTTQLWEPALQNEFKVELGDLLHGKWNAGQIEWGSPTGTLDMPLGPFGPNIPASVRTKAQAVWNKINSGWNPFQGPLKDVSGKVRVPAGTSIDPRDPKQFIYSNWTWPVHGVVGG